MRSGPNYDQFYARREPWSTIIVSRARLCEFLLPSSQLQHLTASFATRMVSRLMAATLANRRSLHRCYRIAWLQLCFPILSTFLELLKLGCSTSTLEHL